jgi:hypothetical protein
MSPASTAPNLTPFWGCRARNAANTLESIGSGESMTDTAIRGGLQPTLSDRGPAYAVMQKCLAVQKDATPRGSFARFFGVTPLREDARSWYQGALGELEVARSLAKLGPEWTVLHAVPVGAGDSDIDHVVIGPAGVFTLNTKNHPGKRVFAGGRTFMVNGHKQHYVRNSEHEAARASMMLSDALGVEVAVTPVIVVVGAESIVVGSTPPAVEVRSSGQIGRWLARRKVTLTDEEILHVSRVAGRRGTWHTGAVVLNEADRHAEDFEQLRKQVDAAAHRQRLWVAAGTLVALLAVVGIAHQLLLAFAGAS